MDLIFGTARRCFVLTGVLLHTAACKVNVSWTLLSYLCSMSFIYFCLQCKVLICGNSCMHDSGFVVKIIQVHLYFQY